MKPNIMQSDPDMAKAVREFLAKKREESERALFDAHARLRDAASKRKKKPQKRKPRKRNPNLNPYRCRSHALATSWFTRRRFRRITTARQGLMITTAILYM